ncbi:extracellular solute-binding protein [Schleiferilactobacillus harbinensis]|nr:extracellular solute-binding protein [Schleiferilactobacillus harbinensis]
MRFVATVALSLVAAVLLTACGSSSSNTGSSSGGKITIRILTRQTGQSPQVKVYNDVLKKFQKDHKNVKIVDESQGDENSYNNLLKTARSSNDLPNIFIVQGVANLGEYIDNGMITNMAPYIKEDKEWGSGFTKGSLDYLNVPGHKGTYGVPVQAGLVGVYYNQALLKKAGFEEFPKTFDEFETAVKKLRAMGITPLTLGAKDSYTVGHLHNLIFYHMLGVDAAKKLGQRKMKWTDPAVVKTIQQVKDLRDMKAFDPNAAGIDSESASAAFKTGKAAMMITGVWSIPIFNDPSNTQVSKDVRFAKFPYFENAPQFKDDDMQGLQAYQIRGDLKGEAKKLTIELVKRLSDKKFAKDVADAANQILPRTDYTVEKSKSSILFEENMQLAETSKRLGVDVFDFDPIQSMQDVTRNALVGVIQGDSAKKAAQTIQETVDNKGQ